MKNIFLKQRSEAITVDIFLRAGLSAEIFCQYCELCIQLRSAIILEEIDKNYHGAADILDDLLSWYSETIGEAISPSFDLLYALKRKIRYIEHSDFSDVGDVPYIYRSESDFRYEIEKSIGQILSDNQKVPVIYTPYCDSKSQANSLLEGLEAEKEKLISEMSLKIPDSGDEIGIYNWARQKSSQILQLEDINNQIISLLWRIEEFENGGEFDPEKNTLYVYQGFIKCQRDNHHIICVNAKLKGTDGKPLYLNVNYCTECKRFFISYTEYLHYRNMYGILIARIIMVHDGEFSSDTDYLAAESPLKLCGYSVSQADGLSERTRQHLLSDLIHENVIPKSEIIRYLSWFIQMNGQRYGNELACKKWTNDLNYVRNLGISDQNTHEVSDIKPYPGYKNI